MWRLKEYASEIHGIASAVQLRAFIEARLGVIVTVQTLRTLMRSEPPAPRKEMIQLLCDAFNCSSDAFYVLHANPARAQQWAKEGQKVKKHQRYTNLKLASPSTTLWKHKKKLFKVSYQGSPPPYRRPSPTPEPSSRKL